MKAQATTNTAETDTMIALNVWLDQMGRTPITGYRWRKKGWIETVNIAGRVYITGKSIRAFNARAVNGEFATEHKAPGKVVA
jgi:hypothetical protein